MVTIGHGDPSTYFIGSTNNQVRKSQANSVLLWHAILNVKNAGLKWFDIGGLNEVTPQGVASFKKSLNALPYKLVGEWRRYYLPKWLRI